MQITLYPEQEQALAAILNKYKEQPVGGRALVVAPTGFGKTILFSSLARELKGIPMLILAHRTELLKQARDKIQMIDSSAMVGLVGDGIHEYGAPITVANVATISQEKHLKNLLQFGFQVVVVDECHHARATGYVKVLKVLENTFQLGVTATPDRLDGQSLEPLFGRPVFSMNMKEGIALKRLCNLKCIAVQTKTILDDVSIRKNLDGDVDFNEKQLSSVVDNPERNALLAQKYLELGEERRAIGFGVNVEHCKHLSEACIEAGIPSAYITGFTSTEERNALYDQLRRKEIHILWSIQVLTEGFDMPEVSCIIMARPTKSRGLYVQCIGRGLRLAPGKKNCLLLEATDNCYTLKLVPQNLKSATQLDLKEGEDALASIEREEEEKAEKEAQEKRAVIRKINAHKKDHEVDLLNMPEWSDLTGGGYVMTVGPQKHRIALIPSKTRPGDYEVCARMATSEFKFQRWEKALPLAWAMSAAEQKARQLLEDPKAWQRLDQHAPWRKRQDPPTEKQIKFLDWKKIPYNEESITKAQASQLIDAWHKAKEAQDRAKAERAAAKQQKLLQKEEVAG